MKKFLFLILFLNSLYASDIPFQGPLVKDHVRIKGIYHHVVILDDDTTLRLYPVKDRPQSISEWWNGIVPSQPDASFIRDLSTLSLDQPVTIYELNSPSSPIKEVYGVENFKKSEFLFFDSTTGQYAFARSASPDSFTMSFLSLDASNKEELTVEDIVSAGKDAYVILSNGVTYQCISTKSYGLPLPVDNHSTRDHYLGKYPPAQDPKGRESWIYFLPVLWEKGDPVYVMPYNYIQDFEKNHHKWKLYFKDELSQGEFVIYNRSKEHFLLVKGLKLHSDR